MQEHASLAGELRQQTEFHDRVDEGRRRPTPHAAGTVAAFQRPNLPAGELAVQHGAGIRSLGARTERFQIVAGLTLEERPQPRAGVEEETAVRNVRESPGHPHLEIDVRLVSDRRFKGLEHPLGPVKARAVPPLAQANEDLAELEPDLHRWLPGLTTRGTSCCRRRSSNA